jgi:hypothetical protein
VTANKLVCPHCGHDGTVETSQPPLGSFGFNYLAEGTVCREVRGFDAAGRLLLSNDFRCEGAVGANARIECRSCWRTFAVPEDFLPGPASGAGAAPAGAAAPVEPAEVTGAEGAAEAISRNLLAILRASVEEAGRISAAQVSKLAATVSELAQTVESLQPLAAEVPALRDRIAALTLAQEQTAQRLAEQAQAIESHAGQQAQWREQVEAGAAAAAKRLDAVEAGLSEARQTAARLDDAVAQLSQAQMAGRARMDAQAEVIRALHAAAQEQITRREELRAAVQRLEELASGLDIVKPLPDTL